MSGQGGRGGGCLLWFINWIINIVTNRRIRKYNKQSRGLEEYESITTDILFPADSYQESIIISGGDTEVRQKFSERIIRNCAIHGRPMIILHLSNDDLEITVARNNFGIIINKRNKQFDAFTSFKLHEICQVVFDTCKRKYDIKPAGRYILQMVFELLAAQKKRPYFANYANFAYNQIPGRISGCLASGLITDNQADNLNSLLMMGQAELAKIDAFFCDMKAQSGHIAAANPSNVKAQSILSAIKKNKTLCIDLKSSANAMLVELIVNTLVIAMNRGYEFSLFLDDVAIASNEMLKNMLCQKSSHNNVICSKDLYALLGGNDDVFMGLVGEAEKTVLLSHASHLSCEKWSRYIGEYEKIDVSRNANAGWSQSSRWGFSANRGQTMTDKREYKVKPEQINRLSRGEVFIYDNQTGSLIQSMVD